MAMCGADRWQQGTAWRRASGLIRLGVLLCAAVTLAGCDQLGIETPQKQTERKMAEAKAVGGACRHALRAIEDCYTLNPKADKSAVYEGWREMDEYMRENSLEGIPPVVPRPDPKVKRKADADAEADGEDVIEEGKPAASKAKAASGA